MAGTGHREWPAAQPRPGRQTVPQGALINGDVRVMVLPCREVAHRLALEGHLRSSPCVNWISAKWSSAVACRPRPCVTTNSLGCCRHWPSRPAPQYDEQVLERLALIGLGQAAGLSLQQIGASLPPQRGCLTLDREALLAQADVLQRQIIQLQRAGTCNVRRPARRQRMPKCGSFRKLLRAQQRMAVGERSVSTHGVNPLQHDLGRSTPCVMIQSRVLTSHVHAAPRHAPSVPAPDPARRH